MADVEATVRDRLLSIAAVTALVSTRITTGTLPQSPVLPAVLVEHVDDVETGHLRGGDDLMTTFLQVTSVASTRAAAVAVDAAVQGDLTGSAMSFWRGTTGSPGVTFDVVIPDGSRQGYDPVEIKQYRINRFYRVKHHR